MLADEKCSLVRMKLEGNPIATEGLKVLSTGLRINRSLEKLNLRNCGINEEGGRTIQLILANIHSPLKTLKVCQNPLKESGLS